MDRTTDAHRAVEAGGVHGTHVIDVSA
ncbi:hypothetical protein [Saccharothrix lopnurensis]|uniref:Uncharacterized protein n=1 Tax=Saccharothrix lopnurensis TaxID=1670621 RepID=A0ABW1P2F7_9PSEU